MASDLSDDQQERVRAFFVAWSAAHVRAGFAPDAPVQVAPWGPPRVAEPVVSPEHEGAEKLIPDGTLAWAIVKVRPYNLDQGLVLTPSKSTEGDFYLDVELTIIDGPYSGWKVLDPFTLKGHEKSVMMGMERVRHILEIGREIVGYSPTDAKYRLAGEGDMALMCLDELRCAIKIGAEPKNGDFPAKNKVVAYLSPNPKSYTTREHARLVAGDTAPFGRAKVSKKKVRLAAPIRARLDDPVGIAAAYLQAVGDHDSQHPQFTDYEEWEAAAGAFAGMVRADGTIETTMCVFDDEGIEAGAPDDEVDDDENSSKQATPLPSGLRKTWNDKTRLIELAGGKVAAFAFDRGDGETYRYGLRCGFIEAAIVAGDEVDRDFQKIGMSTLGVIRLGHILALDSDGAGGETMDGALLRRAASKWKMTGGNFDVLRKLPGIVVQSQGVSFVVPRWILSGALTAWAGDAGSGKSTILHDLALIVGQKPEVRDPGRRWLDVPVAEIAHGTAIFLSGEDGAELLVARREALGSNGTEDIIEIPLNGDTDPAALLETLRTVPNVKLLVVDPARSFIKGNEDESSNVDEALSTLARFGEETGCAVVMPHHLRKNARPASPHDAVEGLRGSGAFKARARVAIGMVRRGDVISLGVAKHNVPPPFKMQTETKKFRRQESIPRLVAIDGAQVPVDQTSSGTDADMVRIVEAIAAAHGRGARVTRTGRQGIFESDLPELAGMSRVNARAATKRAVDSGAIAVTAGGYLVPRGTNEEAVAAVAVPVSVNSETAEMVT